MNCEIIPLRISHSVRGIKEVRGHQKKKKNDQSKMFLYSDDITVNVSCTLTKVYYSIKIQKM